MSSISTGVGLISGIPIQQLVNSLIAVQSRPITLLQSRLQGLGARKAAYLGLSAQLLAIRNAGTRFGDASFFTGAKATSSNTDAIIASASAGASLGQYNLTVRRLASNHHLLSAGFATADATPLGAGTVTFESAAALLNRPTPLSAINGGAGVQSGRIRVTDRAGGSAEIDLTSASTIQDVVDAVNGQSAAHVAARIEGDHLVIEDQTGLAAGTLSVAEVGVGRTAADLGIRQSSAAGAIVGADVVSISSATRLSALNDGNGVRPNGSLPDFEATLADGSTLRFDLSGRLSLGSSENPATPLAVLNRGAGVPPGKIKLTNKAGQEAVVDLTQAQTVADVKAAIDGSGIGITVTAVGSHFLLSDGSTGTNATTVGEVDGGTTASALGLAGSSTTGSIAGKDINFVETVGDVLRVINVQANNGGKLVASISSSGAGLTLTDTTAGDGTLAINALNGSSAAADLGLVQPSVNGRIDSTRLLAGLSSVLLRSLNGGSGVRTGVIQLTDSHGAVADVDLSGKSSLDEVIAAINSASTTLRARVGGSGLGIEIFDSNPGGGSIRVADLSGHAAEDLHVQFNGAGSVVASGNLQKQYVSTQTTLASYNDGAGVPAGKFRITNRAGQSAVVDLTQGNEKTLADVISEINSRGIGITASINATGDGLLLTDSTQGVGRLTVADESGTAAAALGIVGQSADGQNIIDGSNETRVVVAAGDTLQSLVTKIHASGAAVNASIVNDGSASQSYRLSLTSTVSGSRGQIALDTGALGLSFDTLAAARDAVVLLGDPATGTPLVLTSSSNTLTDAIPGVRLDLVGVSTQPVTVNVSSDVDSIVSALTSFTTAFNTVIDKLRDLTRFDPESQVRGVLQGDSTASRVRDRLVAIENYTVPGLSGRLSRLSGVGVTVSSGARLTFDEQKFRAAFAADPQAVQELFTKKDVGLGDFLDKQLDLLTDGDAAVIPASQASIASSEAVINDRIGRLQALLERRRQRLTSQFNATENILAQLQSQQSALGALTGLTT